MRATELGGRAGGCDWNPTAPARRQTDTASNPGYGRVHVPSPPIVPAAGEIEGFLCVLARIVRRLASVPAAPEGDLAMRTDAAMHATTENKAGSKEVHRACRCLPTS
jgi:hypothetical protein